jgi:hypothetical protein
MIRHTLLTRLKRIENLIESEQRVIFTTSISSTRLAPWWKR